jgi:hypothetical protein
MSDPLSLLSGLRRPRLLIRAARHGMIDYRRDRDLRRLIGTASPPSPDALVRRLMTEEAELETTRCAGEAGYSLTRHLDVLIALMAEARLLTRDIQA